MSSQIKLTHLATHVRSLGGMYALVRRHWKVDPQWGFDSNVVTLFERNGAPMDRVTDLELTWRHCIREARRRLAQAFTDKRSDITIYHNLWGLPFFAEIDPAQRRIGLLHSDWPGLESLMPSHRGLLDGLICVSEPLVQLARRTLPELPPARVVVLPSPIDAPNPIHSHPPLSSRPIVLGCCGRVEKAQKRVDRLPGLCAELDRAGLSYQLELLGDGPDRTWLEHQFRGRGNIRFHGQQQGEAYWKALANWDLILFVSDFEGLPLALLEAMSQGVLPLFPKIGCGGDDYAERVHPSCLYPPSDFRAIVSLLRELQRIPVEEIVQLRQKSREIVAPHLGDVYQRRFTEFVRFIFTEPRLSIYPVAKRPFFWLDFCPFALLRRAFYHHFFKPNTS